MKKVRVFESVASDTYFQTLSGAIDGIRDKAKSKGYELVEDEVFRDLGTGGVAYGTTKKGTFSLSGKNGIEPKKRIAWSIYRMDSGTYELTAYFT